MSMNLPFIQIHVFVIQWAGLKLRGLCGLYPWIKQLTLPYGDVMVGQTFFVWGGDLALCTDGFVTKMPLKGQENSNLLESTMVLPALSNDRALGVELFQ